MRGTDDEPRGEQEPRPSGPIGPVPRPAALVVLFSIFNYLGVNRVSYIKLCVLCVSYEGVSSSERERATREVRCPPMH